MKRGILFLTFLLSLNLVLASNITKTVQPSAEPSSQIPVELEITTETGAEITITETIPEGTTIETWSIEGSEEENINYAIEGNRHIWTFTASAENPNLDYKLNLPLTATGLYNVKTDYVFPDKEGSLDSDVVILDRPIEEMPEELQKLIEPPRQDMPVKKEKSEKTTQEQEEEFKEEKDYKTIGKVVLWTGGVLVVILIIVFLFYKDYKRKKEEIDYFP